MRKPTTTRRPRRFAAVFVLVASTIATTGVAAGEEGSIREAREQREDAAGRAAQAAEALELVEAEDSEVAGALMALDTVVALQEARIAEARQAIEAAEAEATLRWVETERVATEIEDLRQRLRELAVDVYVSSMRPGAFLDSEDMTTAVLKSALLDAVIGDHGDLVARLRTLETDREDIARSADQAIGDAERRQREIESSLVILESRIASREAVRDELQERIQAQEAEVARWEREQYLMAILIDNLIAEELRRSAPDLTKESGQGFIMPIEGKIASGFGIRTHPILGTQRMHNGIDFSCVRDQPIWTAKLGSIIFAGWREGYGNIVLVEHEGPVITLYAHMNELLVSESMEVSTGDLIGKCGSSGRSTGPHLHFEVRSGGEPKDPLIVLPG